MSRTLVLTVPNCLDVRIHHNTDWSGVAIIRVERKFERVREYNVPGEILKALMEHRMGEVREDFADLAQKLGLQFKQL